jgi:hypothetical protein
MQYKWKAFLRKLKEPPLWLTVLTITTCILSAAGSLCTLLVKIDNVAWEILSYCLYALAAISLSYAVYILVKVIPTLKKRTVEKLESHKFTHTLMRNYGFRTVIFAIGSFSVSVMFGLYNGVLGIIGRSIWFGALAAYYIFLAFLRGGILLYHNKKRQGIGEKENRIKQIKIYRNGGLMLLVLNIALSFAMAQMIFNDEGFEYPGWTIFAFAAYAFYKIIMAIYNLFKAKKQDDLTVQAIRNINLMDGAVSILALQTALLHAFTKEGTDISLFNTLTASAVTAIGIFLVVSMLVKAYKKMKEIRMENTNGKQGV